MAEKLKDKFADEVNDRLSEFFGSAEGSGASPQTKAPRSSENSEWLELQAIVLSIEWEISNEIMAQLIAKTDHLMKMNRKNTVVCSLLKLLNSVGRYINTKKASAHPDSIKLLHSIHNNLQKVASSGKVTAAESQKMLSAEMAKFNNLKRLLAKAPAQDKVSPQNPKAPAPEQSRNGGQTAPPAAVQENVEKIAPPRDPVLLAIEELKGFIGEELKMLREEIKKIRR